MFGGNMKLPRCAVIMCAIVICGCESQSEKQTPVTMLPFRSLPTNATQEMNQPHLQGDSLDADKQAALGTDFALVRNPECFDYMNEVLSAIVTKTSALDYSKYAPSGNYDIRIELYQDGRIGNVAIYGYTNATITPLHIQAIKNCSPLPQWPDKMRSIVGREYWIMYIRSGWGGVPGPGGPLEQPPNNALQPTATAHSVLTEP